MAKDTNDPLPEILEEYPNLRSLLGVEMTMIAVLAEKRVSLEQILRLDVGSVIVFQKHNSDPITLQVNDVPVASGKTIKVGDHFGLHLRRSSHAAVARAAVTGTS